LINTPFPRVGLTSRATAPHDAREAMLEFVRALARQQAWEDHLSETGQATDDKTRRDLR
jgi:hypothetical protein